MVIQRNLQSSLKSSFCKWVASFGFKQKQITDIWMSGFLALFTSVGLPGELDRNAAPCHRLTSCQQCLGRALGLCRTCLSCSRVCSGAGPQWPVLQPGPVLSGWIQGICRGANLWGVCAPQRGKGQIQGPGKPTAARGRPRATGMGCSHQAEGFMFRDRVIWAAVSCRSTKGSSTR